MVRGRLVWAGIDGWIAGLGSVARDEQRWGARCVLEGNGRQSLAQVVRQWMVRTRESRRRATGLEPVRGWATDGYYRCILERHGQPALASMVCRRLVWARVPGMSINAREAWGKVGCHTEFAVETN